HSYIVLDTDPATSDIYTLSLHDALPICMNVRFAAHKGRSDMGALYTPFETILAESDVITLHCPLNAHTYHLLGEAEFAQMKRKPDRKSTRLNSSHVKISYAVFCLKKKNK